MTRPSWRGFVLCAAAALLGFQIDGPLAYATMQGLCSRLPVSPLGALMVHFSLLPVTSVLMMGAAIVCLRPHWPRRAPALVGFGAGARFAIKLASLYLVMIWAMSAAQWPASRFLPSTPAFVLLRSLVAMTLVLGLVHLLRGALSGPRWSAYPAWDFARGRARDPLNAGAS